MNIILKPVITEKSLKNAQARRYTFAVAPFATKGQIKVGIETLYKVHVIRINLTSRHVPARRTGAKRLLGNVSKAKIAFVELKSGESLDIFEVKG